MIQSVVIIGSGNVATILGKLIVKAGYKILQLVGRNIESTRQAAAFLNTSAITNLSNVHPNADLYIIAVPDSFVDAVAGSLKVPADKIVVHTTGSVPIEVLKSKHKNYGVLYPLQSLRKETATLPTVPLFVDGSSKDITDTLLQFAQSLSPIVHKANDEQRIKLHISAVIVSNFTNYLYSLAHQYCQKEGLDFHALLPLMEETVSRLHIYDPEKMQTGPAVRRDVATVEKHVSLLKDYPEILKTYNFLSNEIMKNKKSQS